jgi:hypothetical protein
VALMPARRRGLRLSVGAFILVVAVIGAGLLAVTMTMPPYRDPAALRRASEAYPASISNPMVALQRYVAVRDAELTPKYVLEDFGCTLLELAILGALLLRMRTLAGFPDLPRLRTPTSVWRIFFLGVAAACLTNLAQVLSWMLRRSRGEFPDWIGLVSEPVADTAKTLIFLLVVAAVSARHPAGSILGRRVRSAAGGRHAVERRHAARRAVPLLGAFAVLDRVFCLPICNQAATPDYTPA